MILSLHDVAEKSFDTLVRIYYNEDDFEVSCKSCFEDKRKLCYYMDYIIPYAKQCYHDFFMSILYVLTNHYFPYNRANKRRRII